MKSAAILILLTLVMGCKTSKLPSERYYQYEYSKSFTFSNDDLIIDINNPLHCPLRVWLFNPDKDLQFLFDSLNPIVLDSKSDTILLFPTIDSLENEISFSSRLGSTTKMIKPVKIELPFPKSKTYKVIQGNNTTYTHNTEWSRYAIDFNLKINDTVCSATKGYVVGVIDSYKFGGEGVQWKPFSNFVTIYEPDAGIFTQYVHLTHNGSLVKVGDPVEAGQPIALSGKTGQTNIEHLHFNCLIPVPNNEGLQSIPFEFVDGYKSEDLKKNDIVTNN